VAADGPDVGRLARVLALVAFVTAVFLILAGQRLPGELFPIAVVAIGGVAMVTAITGTLIALATAADSGRE
jgi:hypothetical protein